MANASPSSTVPPSVRSLTQRYFPSLAIMESSGPAVTRRGRVVSGEGEQECCVKIRKLSVLRALFLLLAAALPVASAGGPAGARPLPRIYPAPLAPSGRHD